jgi:hypothetical protein
VDPRHAVLARAHVEQPDARRAARGDQQYVGGIAVQYIVCLAVEFPAAAGLPSLGEQVRSRPSSSMTTPVSAGPAPAPP